jgi:hypothetical protein
MTPTAQTAAMAAGRRADTARRRERVQGTPGHDRPRRGSHRQRHRPARRHRPHIPLPAPGPPRAGPRGRGRTTHHPRRRADRQPGITPGRPTRRAGTHQPAHRENPPTGETPIPRHRREGLARIRTRRTSRPRTTPSEDHQPRTTRRRPAPATGRTLPGPRRSQGREPRPHDPPQHTRSQSMTTPRVPLAPHLLQPLHFQQQPQSCTNSGKQTTCRGGTPGESSSLVVGVQNPQRGRVGMV